MSVYEKTFSIYAYNSHITVFPYEKDDMPQLEHMLSKWDKVAHRYIPIGYYLVDNILYLPRGTSLAMLARMFNVTPVRSNSADRSVTYKEMYNMKYPPRDRIQEESVEFLTCRGKFTDGVNYTQYGLNLDTGRGKTYCMINAIGYYKERTIIITHKNTLKDQWIAEFLDKTDVDKNRLVSIDTSEDMRKLYEQKGRATGYVYFVNHQTINSYARNYGWNAVRSFFIAMKFGIKVVDEAHKFFENSLMIDFFSNTAKSYYLTATFTRSDPAEIRVFNRSYASLYRFGEETQQYEEVRKHIILMECRYQGNANWKINNDINSKNYGFSGYKYIDYALKLDFNQSMLKIIRQILEKCKDMEGRILITSPKIESVEIIADYVKSLQIPEKTVMTVSSKNTQEENEMALQEADIISATIKGLGEGNDIKGLRVLINTTPIGSQAIADQLRGRLREYDSEKDTYMFYLLDESVPYTLTMYTRIRPVFVRKCKEIYSTTLSPWN